MIRVLALLAIVAVLPAFASSEVTVQSDQIPYSSTEKEALNWRQRTAARSQCGQVATVFAEVQGFSTFERVLVYLGSETGSGGELIQIADDGFSDHYDVLFDRQCRLHTFVVRARLFTHRIRHHDGTWTEISGNIPGTTHTFVGWNLVDFDLDHEGKPRALIQWNFLSNGQTNAGLVLGTAGESSWSWQDLGAFDGGFFPPFDAAWDQFGRTHYIYRRAGAHPYSSDLIYAIYDGNGTQFITAHAAPVMDYYPVNASLDLLHDARAVLVATFTQTVVTGSPIWIRLYSMELQPNTTFTFVLLADSSDGYFGGDGNKYTGANPVIHVDDNNGRHVFFSDIAGWHDQYYESITGQVRYAYSTGNGWQFTKLFSQPGQSQNSNPLHQFFLSGVTVSPGGSRLNILGVENHQTDTEFPPTITLSRVHHFQATNSAGTDQSPDLTATINTLLARPGAGNPPDFDHNSDGLLDGTDVWVLVR